MAIRKGPIRVLHFGLGPIGAAVVQAGRGAPRVQDRRRRRHRSGQGRPRSRRRGRAAGRGSASRSRPTPRKALKAAKPDVVVLCTQLVDQEGDAADRGRSSSSKVADRLDDRGAGVSRLHAHPACARQIHALAKKAKVAVLGTGVNPGFAMDALPIALTGVCERVDRDPRRPRPGRADPPPAVPAEDRRGPHHRAVPEEGGRRQRAARRPDRVDRDDRRRDGLDARSHHRRHPAEARDGDDLERVPGGRSRLRLRHRAGRRRLPEGRAGRSRCTWRRTSARRSRSTRSRSTGSPASRRRSPAASTATSRRRRSSSTRSRRCSRPRRACTRCATCRCRRISAAYCPGGQVSVCPFPGSGLGLALQVVRSRFARSRDPLRVWLESPTN